MQKFYLHLSLRKLIFPMLFLLSFKALAACPDSTASGKKWLLDAVVAYADAMIKNGRDVYGPEHSPLFAAAMDRHTMHDYAGKKAESIPGVRENDRSLGGANPQESKALYSILYALTEQTSDDQYAREADQALKYFFAHCQSPATGLMAWGEHLYWDFHKEACQGTDMHEISGEWPFWEQCYRLAPEASWQFALGLWDNQMDDKQKGYFSRHARWSEHQTYEGFEFPRYAGQMILDWAAAWTREENADKQRRDEMLTAISVVVTRMEDNQRLSESGYLIAGRAEQGDHVNVVWLNSNLELARCLWKALPVIRKADANLAARMRELALKQDLDFQKAPHRITTGGGFAATLHAQTGEPRYRSMNNPYTEAWATGYGYSTHANLANVCFARYRQLLETAPDVSAAYKKLILAAAEQYLSAAPDTGELHKPDAFAAVIDLMINAYTLTGKEKFLDRAAFFAHIGGELFLDNNSPLPKATNRHSHYEAITGGPAFMLALLKLYHQYEKR